MDVDEAEEEVVDEEEVEAEGKAVLKDKVEVEEGAEDAKEARKIEFDRDGQDLHID